MPITQTVRVLDVAESDRHRLAARRDRAARLVELARHLPPRDRLLVEQVLHRGLRLSEVARLARRRDHCLQRRFDVLCRRLSHPLFAFVAESRRLVPRHTRATARLVILEGRSLRYAARFKGRALSLHEVRDHLRAVRDAARAHKRRASLPRSSFLR